MTLMRLLVPLLLCSTSIFACENLTTLRLPDTHIVSAATIPAAARLPEFCQVKGYVVTHGLNGDSATPEPAGAILITCFGRTAPTNFTTSSQSSPITYTLTTTQNNDWVSAFYSNNTGDNPTAGTGTTLRSPSGGIGLADSNSNTHHRSGPPSARAPRDGQPATL